MINSLIVRGKPDLSFFTVAELATARAFKLEKRRDEWLLARYAAKQLAMQLGLVAEPQDCEVGRPSLILPGRAESPWFVSISHSAPYAAAALAREPVGIDIQVVRELAESSSHLFMTDDEADAMRRCQLPHRVLHFWCAKEAAWKQRSTEFATMRQLPLQLLEEREGGLVFDRVTTRVQDDLVIAVTR